MSIRVLTIARAEIGYLEKETNAQLDHPTANAGDNNWTKYARDLDKLGVYNGKKNGYAWCDMFVDWCFITAYGLEVGMQLTCQPMGGYGAGCTGSANYYKAKGQFFKTDPKPGDQIFFTNDGGKSMYHTGIVEKVEGGRVYTIEGNTSSSPGVVPNGGMARDKSYSLSYAQIGGYGRPDYSIVEEVNEMPFTYEQFKEFMTQFRQELRDNDSSDYSQQAREWSVANGLIAGGSAEEFNGMWEDFMTREQFVTVLFRFAQFLGRA